MKPEFFDAVMRQPFDELFGVKRAALSSDATLSTPLFTPKSQRTFWGDKVPALFAGGQERLELRRAQKANSELALAAQRNNEMRALRSQAKLIREQEAAGGIDAYNAKQRVAVAAKLQAGLPQNQNKALISPSVVMPVAPEPAPVPAPIPAAPATPATAMPPAAPVTPPLTPLTPGMAMSAEPESINPSGGIFNSFGAKPAITAPPVSTTPPAINQQVAPPVTKTVAPPVTKTVDPPAAAAATPNPTGIFVGGKKYVPGTNMLQRAAAPLPPAAAPVSNYMNALGRVKQPGELPY